MENTDNLGNTGKVENTRGTAGRNDPRTVYGSIIDLPHHRSKTHRPMSLHDRAAQFAPFATLKGFDGMVEEEARLTDAEMQLSEGMIEQLNQKLKCIANAIEKGHPPKVTITYFVPDATKSGGSYQKASGKVKKVDQMEGTLTFYGATFQEATFHGWDEARSCAEDRKISLAHIIEIRKS